MISRASTLNGCLRGGKDAASRFARAIRGLLWLIAVVVIGVAVSLVKGQVREASALDAGVCGRTSQVSAAIVASSGAPGCAQVALRHLREVTVLDLSDQGISSLEHGDFDGLVRLDTLDLSDNSLTRLPSGLFDELYLLRALHLDGNDLSTIPSGIFDELFMLEELTLSGNASLELPDGLFEEFSRFAGMGSDGSPPDSDSSHPLIEGFIERNDVTTVEEFIEALPDIYKERFVMMYQSEAAAKDHVSSDHPRIIAFGGDGRFTFAWNTDPDAPDQFRESVEFLRQNDDDWSVGIVDFSGETPSIVEPESCQSCHGSLGKPLWGKWGSWPGSEVALPSSADYDSSRAAMQSIMASDDPRIEPLDFSASSLFSGYRFLKSSGGWATVSAAEEAGAVWSWRHAEVMLAQLRALYPDFRTFAEERSCYGLDNEDLRGLEVYLLAFYFEPQVHNLAVPANVDESLIEDIDAPGDGGVVGRGLADEVDLMRYAYYYHTEGSLTDATNFLILVGLWQDEPIVRKLYRDTTNVDTLPARLRSTAYSHLYYEPGEATAEDELIQKLRMHFGRGNRAEIDARASQNVRDWPRGVLSASFRDAHMEVMSPRVCGALRDSKPASLSVELSDGRPVLSWEAPDYDPGSLTGYQILRGDSGEEPTVHVTDTETPATGWTDQDAGPGDYVYEVRAVYDGYPSPPSGRATVTVTEEPPTDDDTAAIVVTPSSLDLDEGASGTYGVKLAAKPSGDVTVAITGHAGSDVSLDKTSLTFTATNWGSDQIVTITAGSDDDASDDTVSLTHTGSGGGYSHTTATVTIAVEDDDTAAIVVTPSSLDLDEGASGTYGVKLAAKPSGDVTVAITGHAGSDVSLDKTSLTFTATNWGSDQIVTVTAGSDDDASNDTVSLTHTGSGGGYANTTVTVTIAVEDDDTAAIVVTPSSLDLDEGASGTYGVKLAAKPSGDVTVAITGHAGSDVSLDKTSLTFTATNWGSDQIVTVTAGSDDDASNDTVSLTHTGSGGGYANTTVTVTIAVEDDDTAATDPETGTAVTAEIRDGPESHDGSPFVFELRFSEELPISYVTLKSSAFSVTGGTIAKARRLERPSNIRWEITVEPDSATADVTVVLAATQDCEATGAVCSEGGRPLSNRLEMTVSGTAVDDTADTDTAVTAEIRDWPESHDGSPFVFELRFSEELPISYVTLKSSAFSVTGGTIAKARRLERPSNIRWEITVEPDSATADVTVVLAATQDCEATGAVCSEGGRPLSNRLEMIVPAASS